MVMIREGDDRRPGIAQLVDQLRDHAARPGPLANLLEAVVVDIDNADRRVTGPAERSFDKCRSRTTKVDRANRRR